MEEIFFTNCFSLMSLLQYLCRVRSVAEFFCVMYPVWEPISNGNTLTVCVLMSVVKCWYFSVFSLLDTSIRSSQEQWVLVTKCSFSVGQWLQYLVSMLTQSHCVAVCHLQVFGDQGYQCNKCILSCQHTVLDSSTHCHVSVCTCPGWDLSYIHSVCG